MHGCSCLRLSVLLLTVNTLACVSSLVTPITVDFSTSMDVPLLKKYAVYNSGLIPQERYTPEVLDSMGLIKAAALRIDLSIGKAGSGFADLISGDFTPGEAAISYNFSLIDTLAAGLNAQKVMPCWGISYNPAPFQPVCEGVPWSEECLDTTATCLGFEDQAEVPGTNNYTCKPYGSSPFDDCWKCPPKTPDAEAGSGYNEWAQMLAAFHYHFVQEGVTPLYEEHWNEPDLTEYYNPTVASYKGTSQDYIEAYSAAAAAMLAADPNLVFGGMAVANQVARHPAFPKQPNNEDTLLAAAESGLPMDFFSYHSITSMPGIDQTQLMVNRSQQAREVLSSERLRNVTAGSGRFNTTEVHCNEFFPNSTTATLTTVFSSSAYLATLLLEIWYMLLDETDLTMVHWAQYMDVIDNDEQIGLIDFWGRPRPAWWAFKWWAELPVERVQLDLNSQNVRAVAGYSQRQCSAGVLIWNVPNPQNGQAAQDATVTVTLTNVPLTRFNVEAYIIDDRRQPTESYTYEPAVVYYNQTADLSGVYLFPWASYVGLKVPVNGTVYLKLVPLAECPPVGNAVNKLPSAPMLRTHHYFGFRPKLTSLYAHFQQRDWAAYMGMGGEDAGFAITGATVQASTSKPGSSDATVFNVSMNVFDGGIAAGGIAGIRMDLPSSPADGQSGFQQSSAFFFYQTGTAPCVVGAPVVGATAPPPPPQLDLSASSPQQSITQLSSGRQLAPAAGSILFSSQNNLALAGRRMLQTAPVCGSSEENYVQLPNLWGSEQPVWARNFVAVDLANFTVSPAEFAPAGWDGRVLLLFVMKDGAPGTKVQAYVTAQPPPV